MKKSCELCGIEYEAKRETSKYCSAGCRVKAGRVSVTDIVSVTLPESLSVTKDSQERLSVTKPLSVTIHQDNIWKPGYDLSEAGFLRRNKGWPLFNAKFKADTVIGATKAHRWNMAAIANHAKDNQERDTRGLDSGVEK